MDSIVRKASCWVPTVDLSEPSARRVSASPLPNLPHPRNLKCVKKGANVLAVTS